MSRSTFSGPLRAGNIKDAPFSTVGVAAMVQHTTIELLGAGPVNTTVYLPAGSNIEDIRFDVLTTSDATTAVASVGYTAGGTEYASGVNVKTAGRVAPTFTGTQLTNMNSTPVTGTVGSDGYSAVVVQVVLGSAATTGSMEFMIRYTQPDDRATAVTY